VPLIGFAGAPWTVATYMIAGRASPEQAPARALLYRDPATFGALIDRITEATIAYLSRQVQAGADVVKLFDSWAGSLPGPHFARWCTEPARRIVAALRALHPHVPVIGFPRGAGAGYAGFTAAARVDCVALDTSVDPAWGASLQRNACVQGNLDPLLLVVGGEALVAATKSTVAAFAGGPHVFNLGHGITPEADPANVELMLRTIRG
jgi:uroporphyrinogen decarboxylase